MQVSDAKPTPGSQNAPLDGTHADVVYQFGAFRLLPSRHQLLDGGKPVRLGSRSLELLTLLVEQAGSLVDKAALIHRAWPDTVVEEINLRVQIAALRKALGETDATGRLIVTVPGRGYTFAAPVAIETTARATSTAPPPELPPHHLPRRAGRIFGRQHAIAAIVEQLPQRRFITIVGPGGMGKTTLAVAVAERLLERLPDGTFFVDLAPIHEPSAVPSSILAALRLAMSGPQALASLEDAVTGRAMLVVLDNCEHVAESAAEAAEALLRASPNLWVLATSREPLRAYGEWLHRAQPLALPATQSEGDASSAADALRWPAVQLFVERAAASLESFTLSDTDAPVVLALCRELDGMPLAIELAAARVDTLGLQGLSSNLRERLHLLSSGRRTVQPRQRTLRSLLDWSYTLLPEQSQSVLRRLAVFQGSFSLDEAARVVADESLNAANAKAEVVSLAERSLLSLDADGDAMRYRMLEVTRAYASELLNASPERAPLGKRHAQQLLEKYQRSVASWDELPRPAWLAQHVRVTDDLRSALDWAFGPEGDPSLGVQLVVTVAPLAFELAVLHDFRARVQQALDTLEMLPGDHREAAARLYTALGSLFNQVLGPSPEMSQAYQRAYDLTPDRNDARAMTPPIVGLWAQAYASGEYAQAIDWATQLEVLAEKRQDPLATLIAKRMLAQGHHVLANHRLARDLATGVLRYPQGRLPLAYGPSQTSVQVTMRILLARTDWVEGRADDASERVEEALRLVMGEHVFGEYLVLAMAACPLAIWRGDVERATSLVHRMRTLTVRYPSPYWQTWADGFDFALQIPNAQAPPYDAMRYEMFATLHADLWHAKTAARAESGKVGWCAPEVLRLTALRQAAGDAARAEAALLQALELARHQGALAWELRCATSLAELWLRRRPTKARSVLRPILQRVKQGLATRDVARAKALVDG